jgi:hypothetical protein
VHCCGNGRNRSPPVNGTPRRLLQVPRDRIGFR